MKNTRLERILAALSKFNPVVSTDSRKANVIAISKINIQGMPVTHFKCKPVS